MSKSLMNGFACCALLAAAAAWPASSVAQRAPAPTDICALLSEAEAGAILGKPLATPQRQANGDCWYLKEGGTDFGDVELILSILPLRMDSPSDFDGMIEDDVRRMNKSLEKSGLKPGFAAERVEGIGEAAYYVDPSLLVLIGGRVLGVAAGKSQAMAVAAKVLPRLKG